MGAPVTEAPMSEGSGTERRLLTVNDVCDLLQVAQTFVYRHARDLGAIKVGSHLRFRREDLEAWLLSRRSEVVSGPTGDCRTGKDNGVKPYRAKRRPRRYGR